MFVGTIQKNRLKDCPIKEDCDLKNRGDYDYVLDANSNIGVLKWMDNRSVLLCSNFVGAEPIDTCSRFSRREKRRVEVKRPNMVTEYSRYMGGVDLHDMLNGLYSIDRRGNKFYFRLCHYLFGVCCVNGWLLHRRHCVLKGTEHMPLLTFVGKLAQSLTSESRQSMVYNCCTSAPTTRRGRPRLTENDENLEEQSPRRRRIQSQPSACARFDGYQHFPRSAPRGRCRYCQDGFSRWECEKCEMRLCLNSTKNCFKLFHVK